MKFLSTPAESLLVESPDRLFSEAVYYPGIDHMHAMVGSTFMNQFGSGKRLGDTLAVATIPVLAEFDGATT